MFLTNSVHHYQRLWHWTSLSPPVATPLVAHRSLLLISCDDQINRIKERGEEIEIMIDYCYSLLFARALSTCSISHRGQTGGHWRDINRVDNCGKKRYWNISVPIGIVYRDGLKGIHVLLSNSQAGPGRTVKQEQEGISHNHIQTF